MGGIKEKREEGETHNTYTHTHTQSYLSESLTEVQTLNSTVFSLISPGIGCLPTQFLWASYKR